MVRTRNAPSPTGFLHIGTVEISLFNYVYAKQNSGKYIIRLEDTDRERIVPGAAEDIYTVLKAYGLNYDEGPDIGGDYGPYVQSERLELYQKYAKELVEKGNAYYCFCSKERIDELRKTQQKNKEKLGYDGHCRETPLEEAKKRVDAGESYVIRLKVPKDKVIEQKNMFGKPFQFNSNTIDDAILMKSDGYPTYYLGVVVDDHLMEISHVWKGLEWQSSDPKLLMIYDAFGWTPPKFGYLPLLLDPKGGKLSKRKGNVSARSYLEEGFLPEAVLNYLMLIAWNPGDEREIFSLEEFIKEFTIERMNPTSAVFDVKKLYWMNGKYLRKLTIKEYQDRFLKWMNGYGKKYAKEKVYFDAIKNDDANHLTKVLELEKERAKTFREMIDSIDFFYVEDVTIDKDDKKYRKLNEEQIGEALDQLVAKFEKYLDDASGWSRETWEADIREISENLGWKHGDTFMLLRFAMTGRSVSPELFSTMSVLGKETILRRIKRVIN